MLLQNEPQIDYEEYWTRLADRKAADPEYQKRLDARKQARRAHWDNICAVHELRRANESFNRRERGRGRLRDIWQEVIAAEALARDMRLLPQHIRIAVAPRTRGCGRAAAKADV